MRCRAGDTAAIVISPIHEWLLGRMVTVLYIAPSGAEFEMPDGFLHQPLRSGRVCWVCEFQSPIAAPVADQLIPRMTLFAPVPDAFLQPIRPQSDDATDEMLLIAGKPNEVTA